MKNERNQILKDLNVVINKKLTKDMLPSSIMDRISKPEGSSESSGEEKERLSPEKELAEDIPNFGFQFHSNSDVSIGKNPKFRAAAALNQRIRERSDASEIIIVNLPHPPKNRQGLPHYLEYIDALTVGFKRCLLVRGCGKEVITMYS